MNLHNYSKYLIKWLELKLQNFACKTNKLCILLKEKACRFALAESVIRGTWQFYIMFSLWSYMKKYPVLKEKEDIFENSEFTSYCKIVSTSGKFLQVRLIIIIKRESIDFWYFTA
jgi:hypothetical protein